MTRIRIQPDDVRDAGVAYVTAADDLRTAGAAIAGLEPPSMPPDVLAAPAAMIQAAGARLAAIAAEHATVGEELQVRAEAARVADDIGDAEGRGGRVLKRAITTTQIVGTGGSVVAATVAITGQRITVTSQSGITVTTVAPESGGGAQPRPAVSLAEHAGDASELRTSSATGEQASANQGAAPPPAPAPDAGAPQGGAPAATVRDALASHDGLVDPLEHGRDAGDGNGDLRAAHHDGAGNVPTQHPMPQHADDDRQHWACWMAGQAAHDGLPPTLPLMVALARSGMHNLPADGSSSGFFGIDSSSAFAPAGHGLPRDAQPSADWWADHPGAQLDHVVRHLKDSAGGVRAADLRDGDALGRWAGDANLGLDPAQVAETHAAADALVSNCREAAIPGAGNEGALGIARSQLGVHESSVNAGTKVDRYLASAGVGSGNPWCASFVKWSLEHSGQELPGQGWAAVSHWVGAADAGQHGLSIVDAAHARPGDIVAYDWGGGNDFSGDGHIGFLDSHVEDGQFTAVEGNAGDAVSRMQRHMGEGNVVFIRAHA